VLNHLPFNTLEHFLICLIRGMSLWKESYDL